MRTCWRSDKVDFCQINKRSTSMQRTTISMFAQLVQLMGGKIEFQSLVTHYQSNKGAKGLTTWSQFIAMLFCQLTGRIHCGRLPTASMTVAIAILLLELMRRRSTYKCFFCRPARYLKLNLMTCKSLLHLLNQPDNKDWKEPPKLIQLSLFD